MFEIQCPWCGLRDEREFTYGGESHINRPDPSVSDVVWGDYLYNRDNLKGPYRERWRHTAGCGQWFNALRHTVTHDIKAIYKMGEQAPDGAAEGPEGKK